MLRVRASFGVTSTDGVRYSSNTSASCILKSEQSKIAGIASLSSEVSGREASAESAPMSDFTRWSRWFECGLDLQHEKQRALCMMGWIAAHAASDGSGLEFDANVWASIEDETGLTMEQAKAAVDALIAAGLLTAVGQPSHERLVARAVI